MPLKPPQDGEEWDEIMKDIEAKIMPGVALAFKFISLIRVYF